MRIKDLNGFAQGVGRFEEGEHQGMVGFVPHTLPGDVIKPQAVEFQKRIGLVKNFALITPSTLRGQAHCQHCGLCPGCSLHSMRTEEYKSLKETVLKNLLRGPLKEENVPLVCLNQADFVTSLYCTGIKKRILWPMRMMNCYPTFCNALWPNQPLRK
jgi:tRNA/tmRNA/rRNA uracil-C5-methylase (TrmA/RlmC/RlmD family)